MKKLLILLTLVLCLGLFVGCEEDSTGTTQKIKNTSAFSEQDLTEANQQKLNATQAPFFPEFSLERENINKKNKMFSDRNRIGYIYQISYGSIVGFYDVKGKVTNNSSQLTNTSQLVTTHHYAGEYQDSVIESPQPDGTYGTSGDAIFWFDTKGQYHEWKGEYMYSSEPLKLNVQPLVSSK